MKTNIERNGRVVRAVSGLLCIAVGVALWPLGWPASTTWRVVGIVVLIAFGGFQLFEAKKGWCIMRACGIRTPM